MQYLCVCYCLLVILDNPSINEMYKHTVLLSDFAVGAPYDDDGMGKVYIYHGSATDLKSLKAAQVGIF